MTLYKKIFITDKKKSFKYSILIGNDFINHLENFYLKTFKNKKVYVFYDEFFELNKLDKKIIIKLEETIKKFTAEVFFFKVRSKDKYKNLNNLSSLLNFTLSKGINRDSLIIAMGGGVTGDLVGFASSILLRGVKCIHIPTTLLSQVDSSVGGKTGINTKQGKNLIGAFYQPNGVLIDINFLTSLPKRELYAGFAEVIKYSFIYDKRFFYYLENNIENIKKLKTPFIENVIFKSCQIKSKIVSLDEKEQNVRAILNFGHTFAHALENLLNYNSTKLIHGEAVSIGMACAFKLGVYLKVFSKTKAEKCIQLISKFNLPTSIKEINGVNITARKLIDKFYLDKKVKDGKLTFILCNEIGNAVIKNDINVNVLQSFLKEIINE